MICFTYNQDEAHWPLPRTRWCLSVLADYSVIWPGFAAEAESRGINSKCTHMRWHPGALRQSQIITPLWKILRLPVKLMPSFLSVRWESCDWGLADSRQRVSEGCSWFFLVCPLGDSLVAARLKLGRENMASSWAAWEDVHVLFFRFTPSVDIFPLKLALSARFYYNLRLFTSKYLIKDKRGICLIDDRVASGSS